MTILVSRLPDFSPVARAPGIWGVFETRSLPFRVPYIRPKDLLVLDFEFVNLRLDTVGDKPKLVRMNNQAAAYVILHFPPQSFAEQAFHLGDDDNQTNVNNNNPNTDEESTEKLTDPPVRGRIAGHSRLAFRVPDKISSLDYDVQKLLDNCRVWELRVAPAAQPAPDHPPVVPVSGQQPGNLPDMFESGIVSSLAAGVTDLVTETVNQALEHHVGTAIRDTVLKDPPKGLDPQQFLAVLAKQVNDAAARAAIEVRVMTGDLLNEAVVVQVLRRGVGNLLAGADAELAGNLAVNPNLRFFLAPSKPAGNVTAIELPYRLIISPNIHARWVHASKPVTRAKRTELWHTRLAIKDKDKILEEAHKHRAIRAIWSPDYGPDKPGPLSWSALPDKEQFPPEKYPSVGLTQSVTSFDRNDLVKLMAGFNIPNYTPTPAEVDRLMLTSLGGWLDANGAWPHNTKEEIMLLAWKHRAAMGRDQYVRIVKKYYAYPLPFAAVKTVITERRFETLDEERFAYLRTREFVRFREHVKTFPRVGVGRLYQKYKGRCFPFRRVEVLTLVTPNLLPTTDAPSNVSSIPGAKGGDVFWAMITGPDGKPEPFYFDILVEDENERTVAYRIPLLFVAGSLAKNPKAVSEIIKVYDAAEKEWIRCPFHGQTVRYAPSAKRGDTDFETVAITFGGEHPTAPLPEGQPDYYPRVVQAEIQVPVLKRLLGDDEGVAVAYADLYLENAFDANKNRGQVFLQAADVKNKKVVKFAGSGKGATTGGLASPDLAVAALSRTVGPIGGGSDLSTTVDKAAAATFDPKDFFKDGTLFGDVKLADIIDVVPGFDQPPPQGVAAFDDLTNPLVPRLTIEETTHGVQTRFRWRTNKLHKDPLGVFLPKNNTQLTIESTITVDPPEPPVTITKAILESGFKINLFGFIILNFEKFRFSSRTGEKPDVELTMAGKNPVTFGGPLEFVNTLQTFIPADGFKDPPDLAITPAGLTASYSLALPDVPLGVFSLSNLKIGASFELPFDSRPAGVRFNFAERHNTFTVTVYVFAGGGFFATTVNAGGMQELEAALEFGGQLSLNLGVASGGLYIKAGIYFHWEIDQTTQQEAVILTGYLEAGGVLSVLGLINISAVYYLALTYTDKGKVWGQASMIVEVEVAFFSKTVTLTMEKQFKGSKNDPTFQDMMPTPQLWHDYCDAFAEEIA